MAEFVGDDALKLIAGEGLHRSPRHADHGVGRPVPRREGVDAFFLIHHEDRRHGHAGSDRHLFDDVEESSFQGVANVLRLDQPSAQRFGDDRSASGQRDRLAHAGQTDDCAGSERSSPNDEGRRTGIDLAALARGRQHDDHDDIERYDDDKNRQCEKPDEPPRIAAGQILLFEKGRGAHTGHRT